VNFRTPQHAVPAAAKGYKIVRYSVCITLWHVS